MLCIVLGYKFLEPTVCLGTIYLTNEKVEGDGLIPSLQSVAYHRGTGQSQKQGGAPESSQELDA